VPSAARAKLGRSPLPGPGDDRTCLQPAHARADLWRVRLWIVLALVAGSSAAAVRHALGHRHTILIPLLLVPALLLGWQEWGFRADQDDFSTIATRIAERDVRIECQRFTGALLDPTAEAGYVPFNADGSPTDTGRLERDACNDLRDYVHGDKADPTIEQVVAVQVLTHESYHLAGIASEAETECKALQRIDDVAGWLGASPDQSRSLAERYYDEIYPRMPTAYRSRECVDQGELDVAPDDPTWP
jgi:hypothetical protein